MREVELIPGVRSSILGFGCAPIMGSVDAATASRALSCAFDYGINHLDLAPSYGFGEAEAFVGKAIRGRREQMTIVSKFGIQANWKASLLSPLKPLVRKVSKIRGSKKTGSPSETPVPGSQAADRFIQRVEISPPQMRKSLEKSLKNLKSDYLDLLLIHDPIESIPAMDLLAAEAEKLKGEGKIRGWGLAFYWDNRFLHHNYLSDFSILQFNNSPGVPHYREIIETRAERPNIFFSPLRGAKEGPAHVFPKMWADFPQSVILCSMFKESHIIKNAELASVL